MNKLGSWLLKGSGSTSKSSLQASPAGSQVDLIAVEVASIDDAMSSATLIMNDDIDGAEERLNQGESAFHLLGMGVCVFLRSVLGFEKDIMAEASKRLVECENMAWSDLKKAQKEAASGGKRAGQIHPPGSEFALVQAEAQLMGAVVGLLHESLTEALKGFYKLRKAFVALDGIMEAERAFMKRHPYEKNASKTDLAQGQAKASPSNSGQMDDSDGEFVDASEDLAGQDAGDGQMAEPQDLGQKLAALAVNGNRPQTAASRQEMEHGPDSDIFKTPIDAFIHSGANMCFGILLLTISMVPPAFSRLLSIIGFKGDRERGIQMLWQSTRFNNINGALAGLVLLGYYNGLLGFADILPSDEDVERGAIVGYPKKRCAELLTTMRARYPGSALWRMEEARALSNDCDLPGAVRILASNSDSKMRQVTALNNFELSIDSMFVQDYPRMSANFLRCVELNDWSHALYYFMAGCAELENYRDAFHAPVRDEAKLQESKAKAEELIRKAPTVAGKKKFMARPLPFEQFLSRKIKKWEERVKDLGVDFADAVGVSPVQEMVYFWNGTKKMQRVELERCVQSLTWERMTAPEAAAAKIRAEKDEIAVMDVCLAATFLRLERYSEAKLLLDNVVAMDKLVLKGPLSDDWAQPSATYEMAVLAWAQVQNPAARAESPPEAGQEEEYVRRKTDECQSWLDKVAKWDTFILDARIGMRVQTGMDTLTWFRKNRGWATV